MQAVMEMQKSVGRLSQAVETLTEESKKNTEKIDKISHEVYAAKWIVCIVGGIIASAASAVAYILWEACKLIYPLIQFTPFHH